MGLESSTGSKVIIYIYIYIYCIVYTQNPSIVKGVPDRAAYKLFSSGTLHPMGKEYVSISQKLLNASGARYIIFWMAAILQSVLEADPHNAFYQRLGSHSSSLQRRYLKARVLVCMLLFALHSSRLRAGVCMGLARMEQLMLEHGRVLPPEAVEQFQAAYPASPPRGQMQVAM